MNFAELADILAKQGFGGVSFLLLAYLGYRAVGFADKFINNHWSHFEKKMDVIVDNSKEIRTELLKQSTKLDDLLKKK